MIVPKPLLVELQKVEYLYASKGQKKERPQCPTCKQRGCYKHCNNCGKSIQWKKDELGRNWIYEDGTDIVHYNPVTRKGCMNKGTKSGNFISTPTELKKTWCNFCNHYYDLSHWCILSNKNNKLRPQLMCIQEVKICNHSAYYDPLTNGWFRT